MYVQPVILLSRVNSEYPPPPPAKEVREVKIFPHFSLFLMVIKVSKAPATFLMQCCCEQRSSSPACPHLPSAPGAPCTACFVWREIAGNDLAPSSSSTLKESRGKRSKEIFLLCRSFQGGHVEHSGSDTGVSPISYLDSHNRLRAQP